MAVANSARQAAQMPAAAPRALVPPPPAAAPRPLASAALRQSLPAVRRSAASAVVPRAVAAPAPERAGSAGVGAAEGLSLQDFEEQISASPTPVLVDFYASWCKPCKIFARNFKALEPAMKGKVAMQKIDGDKNLEVVRHFRVKKLPTVILFRGAGSADALASHYGVMSAQDLELWLRSHLPELNSKPQA